MKKIILGAVIAVALMCSESYANTYSVNALDVWDSTGMTVAPSDTLTFYGASGTWRWESGQATGPDGVAYTDSTNWLPGDNKGELIGYIGSLDPRTYIYTAGPPPSGYLFGIGTGTVTITGQTGLLWLGINDDMNCSGCQYDNSGSVRVNVTDDQVPEPSTLLLLGSGLVGFVAMRRFRKA